MKAKVKRLIRQCQGVVESFLQPSLRKSYLIAKQSGFFDVDWYKEHYGHFKHNFAAYCDYIEKSTFANVNPSAHFDNEYYLRRNADLYHKGIAPLTHYLYHGRYEGRASSTVINRWTPSDELLPQDLPGWTEQKIAIVLHIYYPDFVAKFRACLERFPTTVDVFVAAGNEAIKQDAMAQFSKLSTVNKVEAVVAENRGRNFGPFLVNFSKSLLSYDLMCHVHSKKSLYSGREQTQWFDYLNQFLLKDRHVVSSVLRLFSQNSDLGMYYPTSFWMMPAWVNHWTCNKPFAKKYTAQWGLDITDNFVNYPVGGMFWARPKAIAPLLDRTYAYEDFPAEPLPNDGSELHALERLVGLLAEKSGYKQFFYYSPMGRFTTDKSYVSTSYYKSKESIEADLSGFNTVSFDVFDTVLRRKYTEPDYAKYLLGKKLVTNGVFKSPDEFVTLRNEAEYECRKAVNFQGDVDINDIYTQVASILNIDESMALLWAEDEFLYDLQMVLPKDEMVGIVNNLHAKHREIWFVTDIYYTKAQIEKMLKVIGIAVPYRLFVSSEMKMRKDAGTMWQFIKGLVDKDNRVFVHVGDNVRSDAQICGDYGLQNMHILNPVDKWTIAGFSKINNFSQPSESDVLKWGRQISNFGRYPFFGE